MRKLVVATLLLILGTSATAMADRGRDRDSRRDDRRGYVQRGNNHHRPVVVRDRQVRRGYDRDYNRGYNRGYNRDYSSRRPVYINNNRYTFHDGRTFNYRRPVINVRYTDYRYRPTLLVENYDNVPGYVWVAGSWQWNGYEWNWASGHYAVDSSYNVNYTNDYSYAPVANSHDCD